MRLNHTSKTITNPNIILPGSKSLSNRYLIIKAISESSCKINGLSAARDSMLLLNALENKSDSYYFEDGATPFRFFLAFAAAMHLQCCVFGNDGLKRRKINPFVDTMRDMGSQIKYIEKEGYPPIEIKEGIKKFNSITIDNSISSQFVSALMLIAPHFPSEKTIELTGNNQAGMAYIKMTAACMLECGINVTIQGNLIRVSEGKYILPSNIAVESDWSSAAFFYSFCACKSNSELILEGLKIDSHQGDSNTPKLYQQLGVETIFKNNKILIKNTGIISSGLEFNLKENIDMAPALISACAFLRKEATFYGLENLVHKESNRIHALNANLLQFGWQIIPKENHWKLSKTSEFEIRNSFPIQTFSDHRIAMALSVFGLKYNLAFDDADCVVKSFPGFWEQLQKCNFVVNGSE